MAKIQEEELAVAFIEWVNTFDNISRTVTNYTDLVDGRVLIEIACDVDSRWFRSLRGDILEDIDNWVIRSNKLKRLYTLIQRYYKEVIGYDTKNLDDPNLHAIANESDIKELIKLCVIVLALTVQSLKDVIYIKRIQSLSDNSQKGLMGAIERVMKKLEHGIQESQQPFNVKEELPQINVELAQAISEKEILKKTHQALMEEHQQLRHQYDDLKVKNKVLYAKNENLQAENDELQDENDELQDENEDLQDENDDLKQKLDDLKASSQHKTQSGS
ncbi:14313_t:CDS:2 [Ambispora leptoticha]|uniref:14313_t:CDS:1 n=1 Tax=Ambispora leptoticha TaxID=144679 RepID=A0A9N8VZW3_9GLOM|nr:14313_t:CDS:2 [Ambispora leptoticha]